MIPITQAKRKVRLGHRTYRGAHHVPASFEGVPIITPVILQPKYEVTKGRLDLDLIIELFRQRGGAKEAVAVLTAGFAKPGDQMIVSTIQHVINSKSGPIDAAYQMKRVDEDGRRWLVPVERLLTHTEAR